MSVQERPPQRHHREHHRPHPVLRIAIPAVLVLVWLAIGGIGGPFTGRLSEVQTNDNASFLPASAESTKVAELQQRFADVQALPTFVVVDGSGPLSAAEVTRLQQFAAGVRSLPVEGGPGAGTVGDYLTPAPVTAVISSDGEAALIPVLLDLPKVTATLPDGSSPIEAVVASLRSAGAEQLKPAGLNPYVTGAGGQVADLVKAFGALDTLLLFVALGVVLLILLIVYRSPILPFIVLGTSVFALGLAGWIVYVLADKGIITLNGQSQGILSILVVGAATDYSLLLVARYREELRRYSDRAQAMLVALRRSFEPVTASAVTVALGVLCLLLSQLNSNRGLGPVAAIGIVSAWLAGLTFLPAVLTLLGRAAFWPFRPQHGSDAVEHRGIWSRVAGVVTTRPRTVWVVTLALLLGLGAFLPTFKAAGVSQSDLFLTKVESVTGQQVLAAHFPAGAGSPAVIIGPAADLSQIVQVSGRTAGVASVSYTTASGQPPAAGGAADPKVVDGLVQVEATLSASADSPAAEETVQRLRSALGQISPQVLVGGPTAINLDVRDTGRADLGRIIPAVLVVVFIVLALLLRSLVAPLLLVAANVVSFAATLGASALVFNHLLGFPGADPAVPLYAFVFLVALGIDYSIFLMTRVHEESRLRGTRPGVAIGLTVTGGVITSAGVVLAATFGALAVVPILFLAQIAFIVAFGVLLDTLVVRTLLVPAVSYDLGEKVWWPSRLSRRPDVPSDPAPAGEVVGSR